MPSKRPASARKKSSTTPSRASSRGLRHTEIPAEQGFRHKRIQEFLVTPAKDVMTRNVITVAPKMTLRELERFFETHEFNSLPVVERKQLVGIVTKFDFLKSFILTPDAVFPHYEDLLERTVGQIMTQLLCTVHSTTPLTRVLQLFVETREKLIPVVDERNRLLGVISRGDLVCAMRG